MSNFAAMIELERHIEILLLDNDCVIVPGLGGFMAHHVDASYDDRDNMFLPPMRTLGFNPKLNMNDSLLAQSYVEAYDISYPEALARIDAEVDELRQSVERDGFYELENIGTILLNEEGNYEFEPCVSGILTPDLYGLSGVEIAMRKATVQSVRRTPSNVQQTAPVIPVATKPMAKETETAKAEETTALGQSRLLTGSNDEDGDRTIKIKVSLLRNVFAAACAIIAFFLLSSPINTEVYENGQKMSSVADGLLYRLVPTGDAKTDIKKTDGRHIKEVLSKSPVTAAKRDTLTKVSSAEAKADTAKDLSGRYCIVLACRITKTNAESFAAKLQSEGYKETKVIGKAGSTLKVVFGNYSSEREAFAGLDSLRKNEIFKEAWIYHVK